MADVIAAIPTKKGRSRKALKPKNSPEKENHESFSGKKKPAPRCFETELRELEEKMEKMRIEKEQTEAVLREKEEALTEREAEIVTRGRENEEMKAEVKRLQKMKEFKPIMSLPIVQSMGEKEKDKKEKKKGGAQLKKPSTAYILWCKDQWNEVKKENPDADFGEITNILGTKWKTITDEEKKPYEEKYQAEKETYLKIVGTEKRENEAMRLLEDEQKQKTAMELLDQYLQFKDEAEKDKKTKKEKDPLKPKKPMSAFFVFLNERRAELYTEKKNVVEVSKIMGEEWKNMTEQQKKPYEERAKLNKEKYMEEMGTYMQKKEEETSAQKNQEEELMKIHKQEAMQMLKKKEKTDNIIKKTKENRQKNKVAKNDDPNRPKKPASSFLLFSKQARKDLSEERQQGMNNSTLTALISVKWKELTEEDKQVWNEKAAEAMEAYKKDLDEYNKSKAAAENNTQG